VILSLMQPGDFTQNLHRGGVVSVIAMLHQSCSRLRIRRTICDMYRCLFGVLLISLCAAGLAQKPQLPASDELAAIAIRGKLLYEYDQAAWQSTDAVQKVDMPKGAIDRYRPKCLRSRSTSRHWKIRDSISTRRLRLQLHDRNSTVNSAPTIWRSCPQTREASTSISSRLRPTKASTPWGVTLGISSQVMA